MPRKPAIEGLIRDIMAYLVERRFKSVGTIGEAVDLMWGGDIEGAAKLLRDVQMNTQKDAQIETMIQLNGLAEVLKMMKDEKQQLPPPKSGN